MSPNPTKSAREESSYLATSHCGSSEVLSDGDAGVELEPYNAPITSPEALWTVLAELVRLAEHQLTERCGYRNRFDQCTFDGPCRNRRPDGGVSRCAGDGDLA